VYDYIVRVRVCARERTTTITTTTTAAAGRSAVTLWRVFSCSASQSVESRARVRFAVGLDRQSRPRLHVLWCVGVRAVCSTTATEDK